MRSALCWLLLIVLASPAAAGLPQETLDLCTSCPNLRIRTAAGRVTDLYGEAFAESTGGTTEDFVDSFLTTNVDALQIDETTLELARQVDLAEGDLRLFQYEQKIQGIPVWGGAARVLVRLTGTNDEVVFASANVIDPPSGTFPADNYTQAQVEGIIQGSDPAYASMTFSAVSFVAFEDDAGTVHRTMRFLGSLAGVPERLFLVDTNTGEIVYSAEAAVGHNTSGTVSARVTSGLGPIETDTTGEVVLLDDIKVVALDGHEPMCPLDADLSSETQSAFDVTEDGLDEGDYSLLLLGVQYPVRVAALPESPGRYTVYPNDPLHSDDLLDGCEDDLLAPPTGDVDLAMTDAALFAGLPSNGAIRKVAQVNILHHTDNTLDWMMGQPSALDEFTFAELTIVSNSGAFGNRFLCAGDVYPYDLNPPVLHFTNGVGGATPDCRNGAYSTIISHALGHYLLEQIGKGDSRNVFRATGLPFHEAACDVIAAFYHDTPKLFDDFLLDGIPVRDLADPAEGSAVISCSDDGGGDACSRIAAGQIETGFTFCTGFQHLCGIPLAAAFWDLREALIARDGQASGSALAERLFFDFLIFSNARIDQENLLELLLVDQDTDDDLCNGTENSAEILAAFAAHGWNDPCCSGEFIDVTWSGPVGVDPVAGTDYDIVPVVEDEVCSPHIILRTTEVSPDLVDAWQITNYSSVGGGVSLPIGLVQADWDSGGALGNVQVAVGDLAGVGGKDVSDLNNLALVGHSASFWASAEVYLDGAINGTVSAAKTSGGAGGHIAGEISAVAETAAIFANSVGLGGTASGLLKTAKFLGFVELDQLPDGATIDVTDATETATGDLIINGDLAGDVTFAGSVTGNIEIRGAVGSTGSLSSGDVFDGTLCAEDLTTRFPSANIDMTFGPDAMVCDWDDTSQACINCSLACVGGPGPPGPESSPIQKSRYLTFESPGGLSGNYAIMVRPVELTPTGVTSPSLDPFTDEEGKVRWVGPLTTFTDVAGVSPSTFTAGKLQCTAEYMDFTGVIEGATYHVYGEAIVPDSAYEVFFVEEGAAGSPVCRSERLVVETGYWADLIEPFYDGTLAQPDINDILAAVNSMLGAASGVSKTIVQLEPVDLNPAARIGIRQILIVVDAFLGKSYPLAAPDPCVQ